MDDRVVELLDRIGETFFGQVEKGARHYMEVNIGSLAEQVGYADLGKKYRTTFAVVPLHAPRPGMKVRIDGRTFVGYAEYDTGIAVPGYLARDAGRPYRTFVPNDSMICNFTSANRLSDSLISKKTAEQLASSRAEHCRNGRNQVPLK